MTIFTRSSVAVLFLVPVFMIVTAFAYDRFVPELDEGVTGIENAAPATPTVSVEDGSSPRVGANSASSDSEHGVYDLDLIAAGVFTL